MFTNRLAAAALTTAIFLAITARPARAQVHWDVGAEIGPVKRFVVARPQGQSDAHLGPMGEIHGHVAVLPLLRVGAYLEHDASPMGGETARQITSFGARAKLNSPFPLGDLHLWLFAGFGYGLVYDPSFHKSAPMSTTGAIQDVAVDGAHGGFFDIPLGIGLGYRLARPLEITAELGGRFAVGGFGTLYSSDGRPASTAGQPPLLVDNAGNDLFAIGLLVGVGLEL